MEKPPHPNLRLHWRKRAHFTQQLKVYDAAPVSSNAFRVLHFLSGLTRPNALLPDAPNLTEAVFYWQIARGTYLAARVVEDALGELRDSKIISTYQRGNRRTGTVYELLPLDPEGWAGAVDTAVETVWKGVDNRPQNVDNPVDNPTLESSITPSERDYSGDQSRQDGTIELPYQRGNGAPSNKRKNNRRRSQATGGTFRSDTPEHISTALAPIAKQIAAAREP